MQSACPKINAEAGGSGERRPRLRPPPRAAMSVCFPAPLDENMRLKLILQRRVTEVRALQELRAQQERRKQHIVDLRSRLEHRKRECVEAVEQCKRRAEEPNPTGSAPNRLLWARARARHASRARGAPIARICRGVRAETAELRAPGQAAAAAATENMIQLYFF